MKAAALQTVGSAIDLSLLFVLVSALLVYSLGVMNWIFALRHLDLSIAYPLTALSYAGILGGSYYWFGERLSAVRLIGVVFIFAGVMLVALCSEDSRPRALPARSARE
jgi:drug/metabolite transporter (DMT)-like permease